MASTLLFGKYHQKSNHMVNSKRQDDASFLMRFMHHLAIRHPDLSIMTYSMYYFFFLIYLTLFYQIVFFIRRDDLV